MKDSWLSRLLCWTNIHDWRDGPGTPCVVCGELDSLWNIMKFKKDERVVICRQPRWSHRTSEEKEQEQIDLPDVGRTGVIIDPYIGPGLVVFHADDAAMPMILYEDDLKGDNERGTKSPLPESTGATPCCNGADCGQESLP